MALKTNRKCTVCGKVFNILENDYIFYKNGMAEVGCYKDYKINKGKTEEIVNIEIEEMLDVAKKDKEERIQKEIEKERNKARAKSKELNRKKNLGNLIDYFTNTYNITYYPKFFYTKLAEINNGNYKGITEGIPYDDLLDMFKKKQGYLDKVAFNRSKVGKEISGISRINYDLAVLISKYDEYLSWKNKQKVIENSVQIQKEDKDKIKIDYKEIKQTKEDTGLDVSDIINDIF